MEVAEQQDHFDRLPDALLLLIFNKLLDAKALCLCLPVCKRFSFLVPQINSLFLSIPPRSIPTSRHNNGFLLTSLRIFFKRIITKPLKNFRRVITLKSTSNKGSNSRSYLCMNNVLKKFEEIKFVHLQFPFYGNGNGIELVGGDCLVKWKAEFGAELKSCIILGATSCVIASGNDSHKQEDELQDEYEQFLTDDQLKLRIIWTISCLIAASARHHFLKQILLEHPSLESVVISDEKNQGKFCMGQEELVEMRSYMDSKASMERTPLPDLSIKLSYAPVLELPASGYTMTGATLIVIGPLGDQVMRKESNGDGDLYGSGFDGDGEEKVFGESVKEMMKMKKSYVMTMNSF